MSNPLPYLLAHAKKQNAKAAVNKTLRKLIDDAKPKADNVSLMDNDMEIMGLELLSGQTAVMDRRHHYS